MRRIGLILVVLGAFASCAGAAGAPNATGTGGTGASNDYPRCATDTQCGQARACFTGTCLPRAATQPRPWAIEIRQAGTNLITEIFPAPDGTTWPLSASGPLELDATFAVGDTTAFPLTANTVLEVPSLIPGRPPLTFENSVPPGEKWTKIRLPDTARTRLVTLKLIPLTPADQSSPPYQFSAVVPLTGDRLSNAAEPAANFTLQPPSPAAPRGVLLDAFGVPKLGYVARAYHDGSLVSNSAATTATGEFILSIPKTVSGEIVVELAPQITSSDPWFIFNKVALATTPNQDLGTVTLPTYQLPNQANGVVFKVQTEGASPLPVGGATVRALTILAADPDSPTRFLGVTRFWRDATTDKNGNATLPLIPGANGESRLYDVIVVPPAGTAYAATCVQQSVLGPGEVHPIVLARRPVLDGTVTSALGAPVAGVTVTASRDLASARVCAASSTAASTTVTTTTGDDGRFTLRLDGGIYQLDYDPPAGSSSPRLTEVDVDVRTDVTRPVRLPTPALVEGKVESQGMALANATIRIFEPQCAMAEGCLMPPLLRAQTQTDANGQFRAVVADPAGN